MATLYSTQLACVTPACSLFSRNLHGYAAQHALRHISAVAATNDVTTSQGVVGFRLFALPWLFAHLVSRNLPISSESVSIA